MSGKTKTKQQKEQLLKEIVSHDNFLRKNHRDDEVMARVANLLVDPANAPLQLFPSPFPDLNGIARFPISLDIVGSAGYSDIGIIVRPFIDQPIMITNSTVPSEAAFTQRSTWTYLMNIAQSAEGDLNCVVQGSYIGGRVALPLTSAAGCTITCSVSPPQSQGITATFWAYNGSTWTSLATGGTFGVVLNLTGIAYSNTYTHYSIQIAGSSVYSPYSGDIMVSVDSTAGTGRCSPVALQSRMLPYTPIPESFLDITSHTRVVAMDALVTYMGSSLENSGLIACCNADYGMPIEDDDFYSTISQRAYQKYDGRLAPAGSEPGGAHWFALPSQQEQIFGSNDSSEPDLSTLKCGFFGIKNLAAGQNLRLQVNMVIQFYTTDPSYQLSIPPPMRDFSPLLHMIASEIGLVSSNDNHYQKMKKLGKVVASKAKTLYSHKDDVAALAKLLAKLGAVALA